MQSLRTHVLIALLLFGQLALPALGGGAGCTVPVGDCCCDPADEPEPAAAPSGCCSEPEAPAAPADREPCRCELEEAPDAPPIVPTESSIGALSAPAHERAVLPAPAACTGRIAPDGPGGARGQPALFLLHRALLL